MAFGNLLFTRNCTMRDLERDMNAAKQRFPNLQIIFVVISRKGDPAYGNLNLKIFLMIFLLLKKKYG